MDGESLARMGLTLGLLLGIPGMLLMMLRRFGLRLPGQPEGAGRLAVVSRVAIDAKHSMVLVRRDTREQLILLGPGGSTILEAEVVLSAADKAGQELARKQRALKVEANRAALQQSGDALKQRAHAFAGWLRVTAGRGGARFHRLVEQRTSSERPAPAKPSARPNARMRRRARSS